MEGCYPTYSDTELLDWINRVHGERLFNTPQQMKNAFDTLATINGILLWRVKEDVGLFSRNDQITASPTHTSGEELLELDIWTTVSDEWFHTYIGSGDNVDPAIRDILKDITLGEQGQ